MNADYAVTTAPTPGYYVNELDPVAVHFPDGFFLTGIHWYGLAYVGGFIVAALLLHVYYKRGKSPLNPDLQSEFYALGMLGVILGGRLGYIFGYMLSKNPRILLDDPMVIFRVNEGGMASHGGMIGVWIAIAFFVWKRHLRFWNMLDITVTLAPAGFLFGRIANFVNGELFGRETSVPWAVVFHAYSDSESPLYLLPRHPSQLYAAGLEGVLPLVWTQWRFWRCHLPEGQLVAETMILYAAVRIFGEFFREPDAGVSLIFGLSRGQFFSVILGLLGVAVFIWVRKNAAKNPVEMAPVPAKKTGKGKPKK